MSAAAIEPRFPTQAAIDRFMALLCLPSGEQDWEMEVADAHRVDEFVGVYEEQVLDDDERFTLMELIVASYDDLLLNGGDVDGQLGKRIVRHLLGRFDLHGYTVQDWSFPDSDDPEAAFTFTSRAREVMTAVYGPSDRWPRQRFLVMRFIDWPDPVVPGVPLNMMQISDERDGSFALLWSEFENRPFGEKRDFANVAGAIAFAAQQFGVPPEKWLAISF